MTQLRVGRETAVYKWLILNHTGHHVIRGNYNCVFPGADNAFGTFYSVKGDAGEVTKLESPFQQLHRFYGR